MKMFYKKDNILVDVYSFDENKGVLIFNPSAAGKNGGYGWMRVKHKYLVPEEYWNPFTQGFESKTERNKIGSRLTLKSAIWECTDGTEFADRDEAIAHEKELMEAEKDDPELMEVKEDEPES